MKNKKLITIVVPVYNTPFDALNRCFNSLLSQTDQNFSVIIVNDGSDKKTTDFLNIFCTKNKNFVLINKEYNTGLPDTKDCGVIASTTDYIAFCDSDDVYLPCFIEKCNQYLKDNINIDLICGNVLHNPSWPSEILIDKIQYFDDEEGINEIKRSMFELIPRRLKCNINVGTYGKIYKTEYVKDILFDKNVTFGEDQLFNRKYLNIARNALIVNDNFYIYYQNSYAMTRKLIKSLPFSAYSYFWDEIGKLHESEKGILKKQFETYNLRLLNGYINRSFAANFNISIIKGAEYVKEATSHSLIENAINSIKPFSPYISKLDSLNVIILRMKLYILYFIEKRLIYRFGLNKDKI